MRVGFRDTPWDLLVVTATGLATVALAALSTSGPVRILLGLVSVLLLPGYAIAAALYPKDGEVGWIERLAISVGLSIACVALVGVVLNATPWGVRLATVVPAVFLVTASGCAIASRRRLQVPAAERLGLDVEVATPRWTDLSRADKLLSLALAGVVVLAGVAFAYAAAVPRGGSQFTEFYLLDANGGVTDYPSQLAPDEEAVVILGIANREGRAMAYTVEVRLVTVQFVFNNTSGRNETVETGNTTVETFPVDLPEGARRESPYPFRIATAGDYKLRFLLYASAPPADAYRFVDLPIHVA